MNRQKSIMIDLETWGKSGGAVVVQVGAIEFNPETGEELSKLQLWIDAEDEMRRGFRCDASTLYWWFTQDKDAQLLACGKDWQREQCNRAWEKVNQFLKDATAIWAHGSFDMPIVNTHLNHLRITPLYPYWAPKDLRTLVEIAGIDTRKYKAEATGVLHNALDDCRLQIRYYLDSMKRIGGKKNG